MKINSTMDLAQLAERMGDSATEAEARHMRATLEGLGAWERTEDVPADEWLKLVEAAVDRAKHDEPEHIISAVLGDDADVIELSFDPVRPEAQVRYRYPEVSDEWQSCPFQSADLRHLSDEAACAKVNNWVG